MCKVAVLTNTKKMSKRQIKDTIEIIGNSMQSERDGFGFVLSGDKGYYTQRMLSKPYHWNYKHSLDRKVKIDYLITGKESSETQYLLIHGRTSTNNVSLNDTHPLESDKWTLIHNGVVTTNETYDRKHITDTEHILNAMKTGGIDKVEKTIGGYYAFAAIDPSGQLHICRDDMATLWLAWIDEISSFIFATTKKIIEVYLKEMGFVETRISEMIPNTYLLMKENELLFDRTINPIGYNHSHARHAKASLGRSIDTETQDWDCWEDWSGYDQSYYNDLEEVTDEYWYEIMAIDDTYQILDADGGPITLEEFTRLHQRSQLNCKVIRPDGTLLDPYSKTLRLA